MRPPRLPINRGGEQAAGLRQRGEFLLLFQPPIYGACTDYGGLFVQYMHTFKRIYRTLVYLVASVTAPPSLFYQTPLFSTFSSLFLRKLITDFFRSAVGSYGQFRGIRRRPK